MPDIFGASAARLSGRGQPAKPSAAPRPSGIRRNETRRDLCFRARRSMCVESRVSFSRATWRQRRRVCGGLAATKNLTMRGTRSRGTNRGVAAGLFSHIGTREASHALEAASVVLRRGSQRTRSSRFASVDLGAASVARAPLGIRLWFQVQRVDGRRPRCSAGQDLPYVKHLQSGFQRGSRYQVSGVVSQVALVRRFSAFASSACGGTYLLV